jgi:hypothetical protein
MSFATTPIVGGAALAGGAAIAKGVGSAIQLSKANKALKELNAQPLPGYSVSPEMQNAFNRAQGMSGKGFTAQEDAGFNQNLAMQNNAQFQNAVDMGGGNLGATINAGLQSNNIQAINQRAGQSAQLGRENTRYADELAGQLQSQQNLINQQKIARRQMLESAYGSAKAQANENIYGAIDSIGNIGAQMAMSGSKLPKTSGVDLPSSTDYR